MMAHRENKVQNTHSGFTLLEVMVAVAILAMALTTLYISLSRSTKTSYHAKMLTQATFLARQKMVEIEELLTIRGFEQSGLTEEQKGVFFDGKSIDAEVKMQNNPLMEDSKLKDAFKFFRWEYKIEKISLANLTQALETQASQSKTGATSLGAVADTSLGLVQTALEQQLRKVTLKVLWKEPGNLEYKIEIVSFFANPSPASIPGLTGTQGAAGTKGTSGSQGTPGTATTPSGSTTPSPSGRTP